MVENLPPGNARTRKLRGHAWGDLEYLLAAVVDRIGENTAATVRALGGKAKVPKPVPRPGAGPKPMGDRGGRSVADVKAYLDSLKPAGAPTPRPTPPPPPSAQVRGLQAAVDGHRRATENTVDVLTRLHDQL